MGKTVRKSTVVYLMINNGKEVSFKITEKPLDTENAHSSAMTYIETTPSYIKR